FLLRAPAALYSHPCFLCLRPLPTSPLFPYTTLFRSRAFNQGYNFFKGMSAEEIDEAQRPYSGWGTETRAFSSNAASGTLPPRWRSEEHTSELQSRENLVCRRLLEKKQSRISRLQTWT